MNCSRICIAPVSQQSSRGAHEFRLEPAKTLVNTFVTTKISYANMLAEICEQVPGADAEVVSSAIGLDTRIGRKYLKVHSAMAARVFREITNKVRGVARRRRPGARYRQVNQRQVDRLAARVLEGR